MEDCRSKVDAVTPAYWDERMAVNLRHQFFAAQAVAPAMRRRGKGVILNLGSISWHLGLPDLSLYETAKAAVIHLQRAIAADWAPKGITVNTICPGLFMTDANKAWAEKNPAVIKSFEAAILRWLEYTETRAIMVVSNEGFAHWAKPSRAALKSGRYIRTRDTVFELPAQAFAARRDYSSAALTGVMHQAGVWFPEPVNEMCLRSDRYDQEITLLQFESDGPRFQEEEEESDVFDHFVRNGQAPDR